MQSQMEDFDPEAAQHMEEGSESNAALLQLQDAFVSALTSSGALGKIRAELRATALSLIRGDAELQRAAVGDVLKPASLSDASKVSLLLLYDFLQHHQLRQTAGVFEVESSVHLLSNEQDALLGDLRSLPGEGPLLERLVASFDKNQALVTSGGTPQSANGVTGPRVQEDRQQAEASSSMANSPSVSLDKTAAAVTLPENEDVLREYEAYEPSIAFSDVDGPLDEGGQCDEVEDM